MRIPGFSLLLALAFVSLPAAAEYPNRPVRIVVPFAAGGVTDSVARITAHELAKSLGQPFVVENRPGADGAIAAQAVKAAAPDGYTLFFATNSVLALPLVSKSAAFELADFVPVSTIGRFPFAMYVSPDVPSQSMKDLLAYARANPRKLNYATVNAAEHLAATQFMNAAGLDMVRIPYKGGSQVLPDLVAGRVQVYFGPVGLGLGHVKAGRLRMLATLLPERTPLTPDVPTMAEAGFAGVTVQSYQMVLAPAKTPRAIVERLSKEINAALRGAEVRAQLEQVSLIVEGMTPQAHAAMLDEAHRTWTHFFRQAGLAPQ